MPPFNRTGQCNRLGARSFAINLTEEKKNGQGSNKKQPREEETETGEGKTGGCCIAVFRQPAKACRYFFIGQETVAHFPQSFPRLTCWPVTS